MSVETILEIISTILVAETMGKEVDFTSFTQYFSQIETMVGLVKGCVHWIDSSRGATRVVS